MIKRLSMAVILTLGLFACTDGADVGYTEEYEPTDATVTDSDTQNQVAAAAEEEQVQMTVEELKNTIVDLETGAGTISIRFFPDKAPNHVRNFIELAESGFYDGTKFHRVIPGFMIQGGDPNTKSGAPQTWGTGGSEGNVKAEFNDVSHKRGIVSMARSQHPDSASSQFFIVVSDSPFLDRQYSAFGEVVSGMDVADKIVSAPRGAQDRPNQPVSIISATVRKADA